MMNKLLFLVLVIGILAGVAYGSSTHGDALESDVAVHIVAPGETLWNIAKFYSPHADPRKVVYVIRAINSISPIIYPGQEILVPLMDVP